jgi:hypothetical protein
VHFAIFVDSVFTVSDNIYAIEVMSLGVNFGKGSSLKLIYE